MFTKDNPALPFCIPADVMLISSASFICDVLNCIKHYVDPLFDRFSDQRFRRDAGMELPRGRASSVEAGSFFDNILSRR